MGSMQAAGAVVAAVRLQTPFLAISMDQMIKCVQEIQALIRPQLMRTPLLVGLIMMLLLV
jgi:hypothetical protein